MKPRAGDHIKVSRFGESLWLDVLKVHPGDTYVCKFANQPIAWREVNGIDPDGFVPGRGRVVVIGGAEVLEMIPSRPALRVVGS